MDLKLESRNSEKVYNIHIGSIIKFRIFLRIWVGIGANLERCWKNVKIIVFLYFVGHFKIWVKNV